MPDFQFGKKRPPYDHEISRWAPGTLARELDIQARASGAASTAPPAPTADEVMAYLTDPDNLWRRTALASAITLNPQEAK